MVKLKTLLSSLKEKKRYLVFEIISKSPVRSFSTVSDSICKASMDFLGLFEASKAGILVLPDKWNEKRQRGIIRVGNKHTEHLKSSLMFIRKIENEEVIFRSIGISGTLKKITIGNIYKMDSIKLFNKQNITPII